MRNFSRFKSSLCSIALTLALAGGAAACKLEIQDEEAKRSAAASSGTTVTITAASGTLAATEDTTATGTLSATASDSSAVTYSVLTQGTLGTVTILNASQGTYQYVPTANSNGSDSFTFQAVSNGVTSAAATVSVTIAAVDDAPVGSLSATTVAEDSSNNAIALPYTDVESNTATTCAISSVTGGAAGACTCAAGSCSFTYTPTADTNSGTGTAGFSYTVTANGVASTSKAVSVTVTPYCSGKTNANFGNYNSAGAGTSANPYIICLKKQIAHLQANTAGWTAYYKLKASINLSDTSDGTGAYADLLIGNSTTKFTGTIDGNGYTVSNFTYTTNTTDNVGFIGYLEGDGTINGVSDGEIKNLTLTGVNVVGRDNVGGMVGTLANGKISSSSAAGIVNGSNAASDYEGGLVGYCLTNGIILNASSSATVTATLTGGGGLVGYVNACTITTSSATGAVTAGSAAGGLVGRMDAGTITGSFHTTGTVTALNQIGGLVGYVLGFTAITNSYTSGTVTGTGGGNYMGGLVGQNFGNGTISGSYSSVTITSSNTGQVGGLVGSQSGATTITNCSATGSVTSTSGSVAGLVGSISAGSIINSYATGSATGTGGIGGLVGSLSGNASVSGSYATGNVSATGLNSGGLIGHYNSSANMTGPGIYATGNVTSTNGNSGGLIGYHQTNTTIDTTYATGNVDCGNSGCGGLIGQQLGATASVLRSYATGSVKGTGGVGGLTGNAFGTYTDDYALGNVYTSGTVAGGLIGLCNPGTITRSWALGTVYGVSNYIGGLVGHATGTSNITDSFYIGRVEQKAGGAGYTGGLVGLVQNANIQRCFASADVKGTGWTGGLVGGSGGTNAIQDSFFQGTVTATGGRIGGAIGEAGGTSTTLTRVAVYGNVTAVSTEAGGLIGRSTAGSMTHSFFSGSLSSSSTLKGGAVGTDVSVGAFTFTSNFWNNSGGNSGLSDVDTADVGGITATSSANLQLQATFTAGGWDWVGEGANGNNDYWVMPTGADSVGYPRLTNSADVWTRYRCYGTGLTNAPFAGGSGTSTDPYVICTATQFAALVGDSSKWASVFVQGETLNVSAVAFTPIGNTTTPFTGVFDGLLSTLNALTYSGSASGPMGLIGLLGSNGHVRNVRLATPAITSASAAATGAAVGRATSGVVVNASVTGGSVSGGSSVGGIVGDLQSSALLIRSSSTTTVAGTGNDIGGAVGTHAGTMRLTRATGSATGSGGSSAHVGGLVGQVTTGAVYDSYATGNASGTNRVGGLAGYLDTGSISRCYSIGTTTGSNRGGLIGQAGTGTATNSFWDVTTSGLGTDAATTGSAGGTGYSTANMKATGTFGTWDGNLFWTIVNGSYPALKQE